MLVRNLSKLLCSQGSFCLDAGGLRTLLDSDHDLLSDSESLCSGVLSGLLHLCGPRYFRSLELGFSISEQISSALGLLGSDDNLELGGFDYARICTCGFLRLLLFDLFLHCLEFCCSLILQLCTEFVGLLRSEVV